MGSERVAANPSPARLRRVSMDSSTRTCSGVPLGMIVFGASGADSVAGFGPAATCAVGHGVCILEHPATSSTGTTQSHMRIIWDTVHGGCQRATLAHPQVSGRTRIKTTLQKR